MRIVKFIVILIVILIGLAFLAGKALEHYLISHSTPSVELTKELSGTWEAVSAEFDRRVKAKFPIGTSEADMLRELRNQGFARQGLDNQAKRHESDFACSKGAYVNWLTDKYGFVIFINGEYREEGCL